MMNQTNPGWKDEARNATDEWMETAITRALEAKGAVDVPENFAARVRAGLPARTTRRSRWTLSQAAGVVSAAALVIGLCLLAQRARPSFANGPFDLELLLIVELAGVAAWLGAQWGVGRH